MGVWRTCPLPLYDDVALQAEVISILENVHRPYFINQPASNPSLPITIRSFRRLEIWCVFLVLTPWMFSRMMIPVVDPDLVMPGNDDHIKGDAEIHLLGPTVEFTLLGAKQKAHLSFDSKIGNYLLQPLILCMDRYSDSDTVFTAWNNVIAIRTRIAKRNGYHCGWQHEVSRREVFFFSGKDKNNS